LTEKKLAVAGEFGRTKKDINPNKNVKMPSYVQWMSYIWKRIDNDETTNQNENPSPSGFPTFPIYVYDSGCQQARESAGQRSRREECGNPSSDDNKIKFSGHIAGTNLICSLSLG